MPGDSTKRDAGPSLEQRLAERAPSAGSAIMLQRWEHLLFLHWRYEPGRIQRTLPAGLTLDTFDGSAWVGLVPVFMRNVRPRFVPPIPFVSNFLELNLRTYVYDPAGRPGLYFYSLACDQPIVVDAAKRLLHLRYEHATVNGDVDAHGVVTLQSQRKGQSAIDRFTYQADDGASIEAAPTTLEFFLIERYRLFAANDGDLLSIRVHHLPYRIRQVDVKSWGEQAFDLAGLPPPGRPPDHVCAAEPVDVEVFMPEHVTGRGTPGSAEA